MSNRGAKGMVVALVFGLSAFASCSDEENDGDVTTKTSSPCRGRDSVYGASTTIRSALSTTATSYPTVSPR